jgi:hypothetical protein
LILLLTLLLNSTSILHKNTFVNMSTPRTVGTLSWTFGLLIGAMWTGEVLLGNLGGTSVFGNLRDSHPRIYSMAGWFVVAAVAATTLCGIVAAYQTRSIRKALQVGVGSGVISGVITCGMIVGITILFHDVMMSDPANIHEFARSAHRPPTPAELSPFLYRDALGGGLNHIWIGPLLGLTFGAAGAMLGKSMRD